MAYKKLNKKLMSVLLLIFHKRNFAYLIFIVYYLRTLRTTIYKIFLSFYNIVTFYYRACFLVNISYLFLCIQF